MWHGEETLLTSYLEVLNCEVIDNKPLMLKKIYLLHFESLIKTVDSFHTPRNDTD